MARTALEVRPMPRFVASRTSDPACLRHPSLPLFKQLSFSSCKPFPQSYGLLIQVIQITGRADASPKAERAQIGRFDRVKSCDIEHALVTYH